MRMLRIPVFRHASLPFLGIFLTYYNHRPAAAYIAFNINSFHCTKTEEILHGKLQFLCIISCHTYFFEKQKFYVRSSQRRCSVKKDVLRNFAKFTGKHLYRSLFFNKVAGLSNFIEKEALAQVFSCEFSEISNNTFFTEHLLATASETSCMKWVNNNP